jgi:hypothetical protein
MSTNPGENSDVVPAARIWASQQPDERDSPTARSECHTIRIPRCAFSSFVVCLGREGALQRNLIEALASDGTHLQVGDACIVQAVIDVLAELLHRAQNAVAVRSDIDVDGVVSLLRGAAYTISRSGSDGERTGRLLAIMYDGMRADRVAGKE